MENNSGLVVPGPWHAVLRGDSWYVQHKGTGRAHRVGPTSLRGENYFDAACLEATRRNKLEEGP